MNVNSYLNFDGNTEEAFTFYQAVFGGEFSALQRFGEMPEGEQPMPEEEKDRIMHIALPLDGGSVLMGSDISPAMGHKLTQGNNVYISLHPETKEEGKRLFKELSEGGEVEMPFEKMFWGDYFASFKDKFGVMWMVNWSEKDE